MSALDNILHFHRQNCCDPECYADAEALAELSALRARVAELEAAQAATLTPRKCGTCTKLSEQMREAAAVVALSIPLQFYDTRTQREIAKAINAIPLPTCCDCNPLAPSSAVDELHGVKCECWCECDNYASRNLEGVLLCDKCADD